MAFSPSDTQVKFTCANPQTLTLRVYALSGELLKVIRGANGSALWDLSRGRPASGLYLVLAETSDKSGVTGRSVLKVLISR